MLTTIEAEIEVDGKIKLLEPVEIKRKTRALVTLLEESDDAGNTTKVLEFLRSNRLPKDAKPSYQEIDIRIAEARESWD